MKNEADLLVKHAEQQARRSRAQFMGTLDEIRHRLDPRVIVAEAAENLVGRANHLLDTTSTSVRSRPALSLGAMVAFAIAVGLRLWLGKRKADFDAT